MIAEILAGSLFVFLLSCAALSLGQWFGRAPIHGRCAPRGGEPCANPACCQYDAEPRER